MAWQSPYRGEELSPRWLTKSVRQWISRGVMLLLGVGMAYAGVRGMIYLHDAYAANPTPWFRPTPTGPRRTTFDWPRLLMWLIYVGLGLVGGLTVAAAVMPVNSMQAFVERFMRPPVTGDRSGDDDRYALFHRDHWFGRWWW